MHNWAKRGGTSLTSKSGTLVTVGVRVPVGRGAVGGPTGVGNAKRRSNSVATEGTLEVDNLTDLFYNLQLAGAR